MLSVEIDGAVELRDAMQKFTPDLADNLKKEIDGALRPIVVKARGLVPHSAPLSGWQRASMNRTGTFPWFNAGEARAGIYSTTEPTVPNRRGFSYAASIVNATAGGAIYETAGRRRPNGRKQAPRVKKYVDAGTWAARWEGEMIRSGTKNQSRSDNPNAGKQFIDSMPPLYKTTRVVGTRGARSKKMDGRLIFKAWGQDQGKVNAAVLTAIDKTIQEFHARTNNVSRPFTMKRAA